MVSYQELESRFPKLLKDLEPYDHFPVELLNRYSRIVEKLEQVWNTPDCAAYINSLVFSERAGRQGFPRQVLEEVLFLHDVFEYLGSTRTPEPATGGDTDGEEGAETGAAAHAIPFFGLPPEPPKLPATAFRISKITGQDKVQEASDASDAAAAKDVSVKIPWPVVQTADELLKRVQKKSARDDLMLPQKRRLGEILVQFRAITEDELKDALAAQGEGKPHQMLGKILTARGVVSESDLVKALCLQQQIILTDPSTIIPSPELLKIISLQEAAEKGTIPLLLYDRTLYIAVTNPFTFQWTDYFKFLTGKRIELMHGDREVIGQALTAMSQATEEMRRPAQLISSEEAGGDGEPTPENAVHFETEGGSEEFYSNFDLPEEAVDQSDSSVIGLVNRIFNDAARLGASDIHFEIFPRSKNGQVRLRRDGIMEAYSELPGSYYPAIVSRIKIMAGLDISERRRPQDGRITFTGGRKRLELRVATLPSAAGLEAVVIRILSQSGPLPIDDIGLARDLLLDFKNHLSKPHGLVLVCGPTGSGKTTTLHSALKFLNTPHRKIWAAEDPVEITQRGVNQVQINHKIGLSFAMVLRSFLRADPDVIMIGEMRDAETALIAVESAMTGHLVLSTLHTNSAAETVARVLDMGIDQFNFSDALQAVLAQRLVRRVCKDCSEPVDPTTEELNLLAEEFFFSAAHKQPTHAQRDQVIGRWRDEFAVGGKLLMKRPKGCDKCMGTGYRGRMGVHELLSADDPAMRQLIRARASAEALQAKALARGMRTLKQDGIDKILQGMTTLEEVRAVCV